MNVFEMCSKFHHPYLNIKRDINVQKIKSDKKGFLLPISLHMD